MKNKDTGILTIEKSQDVVTVARNRYLNEF